MLEGLEQPKVQWKVLVLVAVAFLFVWGLAAGLMPWVGPWGLGVAGVLSLVAAGFGIYLWRLTRKSRRIVDILKTATDEEGRKAALEQLAAGDKKGGDAMSALARAQLVAQDSPADAIKVLEGIDVNKAPALVQDDVRANLALMYLMNNRTRDARPLADAIRLDRQPQAKAKAMYAAVIAETFARTGKAADARKLLETFDAEDPEYGEMGAMLHRARVYAYMATKNRGLAKKAMMRLAEIDPNMVAAFVVKGGHPQVVKLAKQVVQRAGMVPRQKMRHVRR